MTYRFDTSGKLPAGLQIGGLGWSLRVSEWPKVQPLWGEKAIRRRTGVVAQPHFGDTVYGNTDAWTGLVDSLHVYMFRGMCASNLATVRRAVERARVFGFKMLATVASLKTTQAQLIERLEWIRLNALDVVVAIEGINEPDKDGLTDTEIAKVVRFQRIIWDYVADHPEMAHITVLSPALQVNATADQLRRLAAAGLVDAAGDPAFHAVSRHRYNASEPPMVDELAADLDLYEELWHCARCWVTETGYHNNLNVGPKRHAPISVFGSAAYAVSTILGFLADPRVEAVIRYSLLDRPDIPETEPQRSFGLWRCPKLDPSTWTPKPEVAKLRSFLRLLEDDAEEFVPPEVELEVSAPDGVQGCVTQVSTGPPVVHLWRPKARVWDPVNRVPLAVEPLTATILTPAGSRTVDVAGEAVSVPLAA